MRDYDKLRRDKRGGRWKMTEGQGWGSASQHRCPVSLCCRRLGLGRSFVPMLQGMFVYFPTISLIVVIIWSLLVFRLSVPETTGATQSLGIESLLIPLPLFLWVT